MSATLKYYDAGTGDWIVQATGAQAVTLDALVAQGSARTEASAVWTSGGGFYRCNRQAMIKIGLLTSDVNGPVSV